MKKFAFVILNYLTPIDTEKCVESIQKNCGKFNYKIYIVDNCSPDGSGEYLQKEYASNKKIETIICEDNLGFARGNNVGFMKAKYDFKADFIVLCNSDTIILTPDFCEQVVAKYKDSGFAAMGPKESLPDGTNYPLNNKYPTIDSTKKTIKMIQRKLRANNNFLYSIYFNSLSKIKSVVKKFIGWNKNKTASVLDFNKEYENIILHGFFLIFSEKYIQKFDGLDDRTYFYGEEDLLALRLKREKMLSIYYPKIEVFHNHKSATKARNKNLKDRNNFVYSNLLKSLNILLEDLTNK